MPVFELNTNTSIPNKKEVATRLSKLVAEILGKPESVLLRWCFIADES
jgi:phenylpyruvate tautomerase PptA (4-oxalocrotonate tautomerase family)